MRRRATTGRLSARILRHTPALTVIFGLCWLTWSTLTDQQNAARDQQAQRAADTYVSQLASDLRARTAAVSRMGDRWELQGGVAGQQFLLDATNYLRDMPGFQALTFADADHVVRNVHPDPTGRVLGGNVAEFSPARARILAEVKQGNQIIMTPAVDLIDGSGKGLLIFAPVVHDGRFGGTFIAVINLRQWIDEVLVAQSHDMQSALPPMRLAIDAEPAFASDGWSSGDVKHARASSEHVLGRSLSLQVGRPPPPGAGIPAGVALAVGLLSLLSYALWLLFRHARRLEGVAHAANLALSDRNTRLKSEIGERREAESVALRESELKSRFLANMSHEIRTPINAIMGMFELIEASGIPDRQRRQASVGRDAAQRLFEHLTNILDLSQLESRTLSFSPARTPLRRAAEEWATALEGMIVKSRKPLGATLALSGDLPDEVMFDGARIGQIMTNLLDNAVKYTAEGTVAIGIRNAERPDEPRGGIVISVTDSGCGIPAEERGAVFDRFSRGHGKDVQARTGAGLGLSIVKELADLMGLAVLLDAPPEGGCRFRVTFPERVIVPGDGLATSTHGARSGPAALPA